MGEGAASLKLPHWPTTTHTATAAATSAAAAAPLKLCDSCKSSTASLFCRNDSAFLCVPCDSKIHAANKLASRHARVWMCEVCEQAPAHVTCKADAAALCVTCDRDIHSANPLARRHERFPVIPFYDSAADVSGGGGVNGGTLNQFFSCEDEEEAASWLMPNLNSKLDDPDNLDLEDPDQAQTNPNLNNNYNHMYSEVDPYLDLDFGPTKGFVKQQQQQQQKDLNNENSSGADGVVPEQKNHNNSNETHHQQQQHQQQQQQLFIHGGGGGFDFSQPAKGFPYYHNAANNHNNSISHSVSSSSHEVGVVPDGGAMIDVTNPYSRGESTATAIVQAVALSGAEREARVMRYREKRKSRKFEKTIRYASRKAYAETRPRIKGRFAKRTDGGDVAVGDGEEQMYNMNSPAIGIAGDLHAGYGVVPSY